MCTFNPTYASQTMAPGLNNEQRVSYVNREIENLLDMLDGSEDCKWIYQSLIELSLLHKKLSQERPNQKDQMQSWIENLMELDPLRKGRWQDLERTLAL